jgi:hypothetical protein
MNQLPHAVGSHALFFPVGNTFTKDVNNATVSATPASSTAKPGSTDTGWLDFGAIEDFKVKPVTGQEVKIFAPNPGQLRLKKKLILKRETGFSFTAQELSATVMEILFGGAKGMSTQFTPLEGVEKEGWFKWQGYDESDTILVSGETWCCITPSGDADFGGADIVKVQFDVATLFSTLNTFTI